MIGSVAQQGLNFACVAGGRLPATPAPGAVAQTVRGCTAIAVGALQWQINLDVPLAEEKQVVVATVYGGVGEPRTAQWSSNGSTGIFLYGVTAGGTETNQVPISFLIYAMQDNA